MKKLIVLLALTVTPAFAQSSLQGQASKDSYKEVAMAAVKLQDKGDWAGSIVKMKAAYDIARRAHDYDRMAFTLSKLAVAYKKTGNTEAFDQAKAFLTQILDVPTTTVQVPPYPASYSQAPYYGSSQPCNSCLSSLMTQQHWNQLELMNAQNGFDRQTFREDHSFQDMYQRQALEADRQARLDLLRHAEEQAQAQELADRSRRSEGTSYMSRYNGGTFAGQ